MSEALPGSPRVMALERSSTASMSGISRSSPVWTATQSPVAGMSPPPRAAFKSRADGCARLMPSGVAIKAPPRSLRSTRAGASPSPM